MCFTCEMFCACESMAMLDTRRGIINDDVLQANGPQGEDPRRTPGEDPLRNPEDLGSC